MLSKKRIKPLNVLLIVLVLLTLFIFRQSLLKMGVNLACHYFFPEIALSFESARLERGHLLLKKVRIEKDGDLVLIDRAKISGLHSFKPRFDLIQPELNVSASHQDSTAAIASLLRVAKQIEVSVGKIIVGETLFYFRVQRDEREEKIVHFYLSYDPTFTTPSLLSIALQGDEKDFSAEFAIPEIESAQLIQIASLVYPEAREGWQHLEGVIHLQGKGYFTLPFSLNHLTAAIDADHLEVVSDRLGVEAAFDHFQGELSFTAPQAVEPFQPFWRQVKASLSIDEGRMGFGNWGVTAEYAHLFLDPSLDPYLSMKGTLFHEEKVYPVELEGKGFVHEDRSFWLELKARVSDEELFCSLCSQEKGSYLFQSEFRELSLSDFAWAQKAFPDLPFAIVEGSVGGQMTAWIKANELQALEFENLVAKNVAFERGLVGEIRGGLSFKRAARDAPWQLAQLTLSAQGINAGELAGDLQLSCVDGVVTPSHFKGSYLGAKGEVFFEGPFETLEGRALCALPYAQLIPGRQAESLGAVSIHSYFKRDAAQWNVSSQLTWEDGGKLECRYSWKDFLFEQGEGWFRSDALSQAMYAPFLKDVLFKGNAVITGSVDREKIDIAFQAEDATLMTPAFSLKTPKAEHVHFSYERKEGKWHGSAPLSQAQVQTPLFLFEQVEGVLFLEGDQAKAEINHLNLPELQIAHLSCEASFDFAAGMLKVANGKAQMQERTLLIDKFQMDGKKVSYDCALLEEMQEKGRFIGEGKKVDENLYHLSFDKATHFFGMKPTLFEVEMSTQGKFAALLNTEDCLCKGEGFLEKNKVVASSFEIATEEAGSENKIKVQGAFEAELDKMSVQGELSVFVHTPFGDLAAPKPAHFSFSREKGFYIEEQKLSFGENGDFVLEGVSYDFLTKKGNVHAMHFSLTPPLLSSLFGKDVYDASLTGSASLQFLKDSFGAEGILSDLEYPLGQERLSVKAITFSLDQKVCNLRAQTTVREIPLFVTLGIALSSEKALLIKVQESEDSEGLKGLFRGDDLSLESIQGSVSGLDVNLTKKAPLHFSGSILVDAARCRKLLPWLDQYRVGEKYEFLGDVSFSQEKERAFLFQGRVKADDFELMGYRLDHLEAKAEIAPERIKITEMRLSDVCGELTIPQIKLIKAGSWVFEIPLLQVQNFQPSKLSEIEGEKKSVKPFIISHLSLTNLQGDVEDPATFTGIGSFHFTNREKKDSHFFDFPMEIIKRLGLDVALFTPLSGEIDCQLKGDRIYFTALKESYSEGGRSQFYIFPEENPSYLTLKGGLHIDLKMKQHVLLKLTEPLTLKIRGTVEKPKCSLLL
jgi:hypothetical protein